MFVRMGEPSLQRYPRVEGNPHARAWLKIQADLGLAPNTIAAYGRGLEEYLAFCELQEIEPATATRGHVASYVAHLRSRPNAGRVNSRKPGSGAGLSPFTLQQRLTAIRLFYDFLVEEGLRRDNPVGRGRYTPGKAFGGERGLVATHHKLPWIPSDEEWLAMLVEMGRESVRNRLMLAFAYDAALLTISKLLRSGIMRW